MANRPLALGSDLGTSGVRIAVIDSSRSLLFSAATAAVALLRYFFFRNCFPPVWVMTTLST